MFNLLWLIGLCMTACGGHGITQDDEPDSLPTEEGGVLVLTAKLAEGFNASSINGTRWNIEHAYCTNTQTVSGIESQFRIESTCKEGFSIISFNAAEVTNAQEGHPLFPSDFYGYVSTDGFQTSFDILSDFDILIEKVTDDFVVLKINKLCMTDPHAKITVKGTAVCKRDAKVSSEPKEPDDTDLSATEVITEETATKEIKEGSLSYQSTRSYTDKITIYENYFRYVLCCSHEDLSLKRQIRYEIKTGPYSDPNFTQYEWRDAGNIGIDYETDQRFVYCGIKDIGEAGSLMNISEKLDIDGECPLFQKLAIGHAYICVFRTLDDKLRYLPVRLLSTIKLREKGGDRTYCKVEYQLY